MISYGTEKPLAYRPRLVDERLQRLLTTFGAVEIRGTKWCGKSWAALAFGESVIHLDDPNVKTLAAADPTLALHGVHEASFVIILSPSGSYFKNGLQPVPIMVETEDVRAVRGGTGEAKCGGNYGAANRAGERAEAKGYSQVLWLDGVERKYVEEGGGMNVMFKINGAVVTPALTGSILRGVTRKSAIELLKSWDVPVEERLLSVDELFEAAKTGALEEAWCIGTAAVISPIGALGWGDKCYEINHNRIGELSQKLYDELTGIQWGTKPDPFGWTCPVC